MDPLTIILTVTALATVLTSKKTKAVISKFVPKQKLSVKSELNKKLKILEKELKAPGLRDFFMGAAYIESKYIPSAIRYESSGFNLVFNKKENRYYSYFENNPYRSKPYLWNYTGGLFQLFPATALKTEDQTAFNLNPTSVFDVDYTIAYAIDYASRLYTYHDAKTWLDIRFGWSSLQLLKNKDNPDYYKKGSEVEGRIINGVEKSGGDSNILYIQYNNLFSTYRNKYGFKKLLKFIQSIE